MSVRESFTREAYVALLQAALEGGYAFRGFDDDDGGPGALLLRHDIDKDVEVARRMAEVEHDMGVRSTYFFLLRCPLYSLLEPETRAHVRAIAELGHGVGLHCDERRTLLAHGDLCGLDRAVAHEVEVLEGVLGLPCARAVSFHNPSAQLIGRTPEAGAYVSAYEPRFMLPHTKYISESNAHWREGDPTDALRAARWSRVQVLVHPIWWAGETPRECVEVLQSVLARRAAQMDEYLRWSNHLWGAHRSGPPADDAITAPGMDRRDLPPREGP